MRAGTLGQESAGNPVWRDAEADCVPMWHT
jgi:hypothetical protein